MKIPRNEYPRPDFERENWLCLNGEWEYSADKPTYERKITVPFCPESEMSGVFDRDFHKNVFYRKSFDLPASMSGKHLLLHFGAVDFEAKVYVNGEFVGSHIGGNAPFCFDITENIKKKNVIEVKVFDDPLDLSQMRGKQYWGEGVWDMFYPRTTGIWQTVWIEAVSDIFIENCRITPMFDERSVKFEYSLNECPESGVFEAEITFEGKKVGRITQDITNRRGELVHKLDEQLLSCWKPFDCITWSPENPRLFDVKLTLCDGEKTVDEVKTYFGMRKVSIENGKFMLNGRPYYQKLLLDQGYWEKSLLTAPTDADFVKDIELCKKMGFNGVRKHQKAEDPRFLYHADKMGFLVWGETSAAFIYNEEYACNMYREWAELVRRDYNHPSIVVWTPLNEGWGVQEIIHDKAQQAHAQALYHITKSLDTTRPVNDGDGWMHTCGDILGIHDYASTGEKLREHFADIDTIKSQIPEGRTLFADGFSYCGQPVMLTEFGGSKYVPGNKKDNSWGYNVCKTQEEFLKKYEELITAVYACPEIQGFCYTQITDVELEKNGMLGYDRSIKAPLEKIKEINDRKKMANG